MTPGSIMMLAITLTTTPPTRAFTPVVAGSHVAAVVDDENGRNHAAHCVATDNTYFTLFVGLVYHL